MSGGEAGVRIGMQNAGLGNPPIEDWGETIPSHLCALTATDQDVPPQPANATLKDAQLSRVPRNGISSGKEMNIPAARRSLDQKHCRYEPHILLVPQTAELQMKSSDHVLHT